MSNQQINLSRLLSGDAVSAFSKASGSSPVEVKKVLATAIPVMLTGMQKNSATEDGERSLEKAVKDHAKDDITDIGAFIKGADQKDGSKILSHVLGSEKDEIENLVATRAGVPAKNTGTILALVAPLLLSMLGQSNNNNSGGITSILGTLLGGGVQQSNSNQGLGGSLLTSLAGSLLGGSGAAAPAQPSPGNSLAGGLLTSIFGDDSMQESNTGSGFGGEVLESLFGDSSNQAASQPASSGLGGSLLGSIFGGSSQPQNTGSNGNSGLGSALLNALFRGKK